MPKLLVFAPCEKVIISQDENNPTLIAILSSLTLEGDDRVLEQAIADSPDNELPMVPIRWAIFSMWLQEPSDGTKEFTQTIDIESPSGKTLVTNRASFAFKPEANTHRLNVVFSGFPVGERGPYVIRLSLDGRPVAEYPLELKLRKPETAQTK